MSDKNAILCPVCDSKNVEVIKEQKQIHMPWAPASSYDSIEYLCRDCGERGDFTGENDQLKSKALEVAKQSSLTMMLDYLSTHSVTMAYVERALELPQRTLARWRQGEGSAAAIALMRMVCTFPWLLKVADAGYDPNFARQEVLAQAGNVLLGLANNVSIELNLVSKSNNTFFEFAGTLNTRADVVNAPTSTAQLVTGG
jgi:hypothetical protein